MRNISVERRKISRAEWRVKFSLKTGIFRKYPGNGRKAEKREAYGIIRLITLYIKMLSSDWLMKGVFLLPILRVFFSFSAIAGVFA